MKKRKIKQRRNNLLEVLSILKEGTAEDVKNILEKDTLNEEEKKLLITNLKSLKKNNLPEQLSNELGEMLNFFIDLFTTINEWAAREGNSQFKEKLQQVGWDIIPFNIKNQLDNQEKFNIKNIFLNFDPKFEEQYKNLTSNILGTRRWRLLNFRESTEGKIISLKNKYPQSFCAQLMAAREGLGNPKLYDAVIANYAGLELKTFYEKIIVNNLCEPDENVLNLISDLSKDLYLSELVRAIERIPVTDNPFDLSEKKDAALYKAFIDEIAKWFEEKYTDKTAIEKIRIIGSPSFEKELIDIINQKALDSGLPLRSKELAGGVSSPTINPTAATVALRTPIDRGYRAAEEGNLGVQGAEGKRSVQPEPGVADVLAGLGGTRPGKRVVRTESIRENFNLKSLSLKEAMEIEYD